jgi:hypothetical protein
MKLSTADLNQKIIDMMAADDRAALGVQSSGDIQAKTEREIDKAEAKIQREVEAWLTLQGYWPRTPAYLDGRKPPRGWWIHLHDTKRNPILLDLLILDTTDNTWLELEIKTKAGKVRDMQVPLIAYGGVLARSSKDAIEYVTEWVGRKHK